MSIATPISIGEFLDKITILEIKSERIADTAKVAHVMAELSALRQALANSRYADDDAEPELSQLKQVNEQLWNVEDRIRDKERDRAFDEEFIELARSVYFTNDKRAELKRALNVRLGSELVEEKSYADYGRNNKA